MSVVTATVFMNNKSQAIRIPKAAELPNTTKSVNIIIQGDMRIITPLNNIWTVGSMIQILYRTILC